jgi:carbonic anhydrase
LVQPGRANFGTAISCIDGRVHLPLIGWMRDMLSVDYVDLVTYAGADGLFASDPATAETLLRPAVEISVQKHGSPVVALVGHFDCAANPGSAEAHRQQLLDGTRALQRWNLPVKVLAIWVNADWHIDVVRTRSAPGTAW